MSAEHAAPIVIGRYALFDEIASGGMASVHYGRLIGVSGFSRTVAIKKLHSHLARDAEFSSMLLDEARLAARIRHPNVVPTLDVVSTEDQLYIVMEYVQGESLARLLRAAKRASATVPNDVACAIMVGILHGLHAAHEATDERGRPINLVHRDVSPQNVLVGLDGVPRLVDFGVAKATGRNQTTRDGQLKGKIAYMAPEQIRGGKPTRLVDIYAAAIVFWEMLTGERLFGGDNDVTVLERALHREAPPPSSVNKDVPPGLDAVVLRGLSRDPEKRFQSAREMAREIEKVERHASSSRVGEWVESIAGEVMVERSAKIAEIESRSEIRPIPPSVAPPAFAEIPISEVDDPSEPPPARRRGLVIALSAVGACLMVLAAAVAIRQSRPRAAEQAPVATHTAPTIAPPVVTSAPAVVVVADPDSTSVPAVPSQPTVKTTSTAHSTIVREFPTTQKASNKPGCNPPYTVDAHGVKQYRLECL